ncbi:flagellar basal-body rod protein FlgB [Klenkia soli]|uniref:Flagellar basal body rod protein FlgB n=1 Tax=Klenkia soli TaxID=1052260 RepID=A0A1H0CL93_9ACTN|nr:flagellar basal body rod protein FlgB [Klenkia soli]SDN58602.1 flagellar basal-body rod protein FlgB [Klenkia soli]
MIAISDRTMTALHAALSGLSQRQRVSSDNIANINTPGFLAGRTDFESTLRSEIADGTTPTISGGTVSRSLAATRTDGNNVDLDSETVIATETGLRYQLAISALNGKYDLLSAAMRTS